jgi:hypothetical protein
MQGAIELEKSDRLTKPYEVDQNFDRLIGFVDLAARAASQSRIGLAWAEIATSTAA